MGRRIIWGIGLSVLLCAFAAYGQAPEVEWARVYCYAYRDIVQSLRAVPGGGYVMAGYVSQGTQGWQTQIIRTDAHGDTVFTRLYTSGSRVNDVVCTPDGGFFSAGHIWGGTMMLSDVWLLKTDSAGEAEWARGFTLRDWDEAKQGVALADGTYWVVGYSAWEDGTGCHADGWLAKLDTAGYCQWVRPYGGEWYDELDCLVATSDGGCAAAGKTDVAGQRDMWLVRVDEAGDTLWTRTYGEATLSEVVNGMAPGKDGGYLLSGYASDHDIWHTRVVKVDSSGYLEWQRSLFDWLPYSSHAESVCPLDSGGYVIAGYLEPAWPEDDVPFLVRLTDSGDTVWTTVLTASADTCFGSDAIRVCQAGEHGVTAVAAVGFPDTWYEGAYLVKLRGSGVDADNPLPPVPTGWSLTCYPNPFNPSATVAFDMPQAGSVRVGVYDVLGRLTTVLAEGRLAAGEHRLHLDGSAWSSGVYFVRVEAASDVHTQKIVLLR